MAKYDIFVAVSDTGEVTRIYADKAGAVLEVKSLSKKSSQTWRLFKCNHVARIDPPREATVTYGRRG